MDLVVGVLLEQRVRDLGQAEPLLTVHGERHYADAVQVDGADLILKINQAKCDFIKTIYSALQTV